MAITFFEAITLIGHALTDFLVGPSSNTASQVKLRSTPNWPEKTDFLLVE